MSPRSQRRQPIRASALFAAVALALGSSQASATAVAPVPLGLAALPQSAALNGSVNPAIPMHAQGNILAAMLQGPWREYARNQMVPELAWELDLPALPDRERNERRDALTPAFVRHLLRDQSTHRFDINVERRRINETPMMPDSLNRLRFDDSGFGLDRTLVTPTYSFQLDSRSAIGVSAVLAHQEFSTFGFGGVTLNDEPIALRAGDQSMGTGVRLGVQSELAPGLNVGAAYQSQIDMGALQRYRNVYTEPGRFDIPASANVGLALDATGNSTLSFDVRHVQYSDIRPFTSSLLPNRFLALLGDGTSPAFAWQDLTVYQVGWSWENPEQDLTWNMSWSSGRQPTPTSNALARALSPELADSHWVVGLTRDTSERSRVSLAASYTPSSYFLSLDGRGFEAERTLDKMEFEARWSVDF